MRALCVAASVWTLFLHLGHDFKSPITDDNDKFPSLDLFGEAPCPSVPGDPVSFATLLWNNKLHDVFEFNDLFVSGGVHVYDGGFCKNCGGMDWNFSGKEISADQVLPMC